LNQGSEHRNLGKADERHLQRHLVAAHAQRAFELEARRAHACMRVKGLIDHRQQGRILGAWAESAADPDFRYILLTKILKNQCP
jgi:hypothetical protein